MGRFHGDLPFCHFIFEHRRPAAPLIFWVFKVAFTIGQTVGDYRILDLIGVGGMGTVYKVQHLISDRIEAMKVILPELIDSPELAERFIREIKVQARLSHPHIAALHNALRIYQQLFMVMEYVDGTTLYTRLKESRLDPNISIEIVLQVLSALAYAHGQGVIHRDIKPANIMFTALGVVKIMDFGIARSLVEKHDLTRTGAALGSLYYMSPEQVQGATVDNRSDLYSVGAMLYEMVTGAKPITGESSWAIMNAHLSQIPRAPAAVNKDLPAALSLAILKALEKSPGNRYQSAGEFADVLRSVRARSTAGSHDKQFEVETIALTVGPQVVVQAQPAGLSDVAAAGVATPTPSGQPTPMSSSGPASTPSHFDAKDLDRTKRELAAYVGPMARIIVDRAAKKATSWQQLYELLSAEVPAGEERKRFLKTRPR